MPWVEISTGTPELTFKDDGAIEWNTSLQLLMGAPTWVELMYNAAQHKLGIRTVNAPSGFPVVAEPEGSQYKIDSAAALDAAGVSVDDTVSAVPESYYANTMNHLTGYQRTYYLTLPT